MNVGAFVPIGSVNANPALVRAIGPALEERGFESLWLAEHVVLFDEYQSRYPYAESGRFPSRGDAGLLEPLTALAAVAATTETLRLATGICLVPQRNPVYTAKQVADLDVISGGRVEFGIGIGWLREEFEALGVPFERRAERARQYIEVMKALWTQDVSQYDGDLYPLRPCRLYPKPVQKPHPPIHVGGESDAALGRVALLGQGWFGFDRTPEEVPEAIARLDRALENRSRSRADVTITISPYTKAVDQRALERYREAGVDRVVVVAMGFDRDSLLEQLDRLAKDVVEPARTL